MTEKPLFVRLEDSMELNYARSDPYRPWVAVAACAPPVLTIVALAYAPILHCIAPTLSVRTFLELCELKQALPALAVFSYILSVPVCFVWLLRRFTRGRARRLALYVALAVGTVLVLALAALLLTAQSSSLGPFIYAI